MDPQITWHSLLAAWTRGNWLDVTELAEALIDWLDKGGFPPKTVAAPELGVDWHRVVAQAAARFALVHAASLLEDPRWCAGCGCIHAYVCALQQRRPIDLFRCQARWLERDSVLSHGNLGELFGHLPDLSSRGRRLVHCNATRRSELFLRHGLGDICGSRGPLSLHTFNKR